MRRRLFALLRVATLLLAGRIPSHALLAQFGAPQAAPLPAGPPRAENDPSGQLRWRYIGPVGNRTTSVVGVPGEPFTYGRRAASATWKAPRRRCMTRPQARTPRTARRSTTGSRRRLRVTCVCADDTRQAPDSSNLQILAPPGAYTVKLTVGGQDYTEKLAVLKDPNSSGTEADITAAVTLQKDVLKELLTAVAREVQAVLRKQLENRQKAYDAAVAGDVANFNKLMQARGLQGVTPK